MVHLNVHSGRVFFSFVCLIHFNRSDASLLHAEQQSFGPVQSHDERHTSSGHWNCYERDN